MHPEGAAADFWKVFETMDLHKWESGVCEVISFRNSHFFDQSCFWNDLLMISVACGNIPAPGLGGLGVKGVGVHAFVFRAYLRVVFSCFLSLAGLLGFWGPF